MDFKLHLLEAITNNFSEDQKVGSGEHGDVYRAVYDGADIAVKRLHPVPVLGLDGREFDKELRDLPKVSHKNVVPLIGYCHESQHTYMEHKEEHILAKRVERFLCFQYMHGGSLDKHIADESCRLDWPTCYGIIKGTCEGLNHLHNSCDKLPIYHLGLKPSNILLDNSLKPKISDLGLSRLDFFTRTWDIEILEETEEYMPPEYTDMGYISSKFDVFSFGVIIIKMLAGNMGYSRSLKITPKVFIELVTENWTKRLHAMPGYYSSHEIDILRVIACLEIALSCVKIERSKRPSFRVIVHKLEELEVEVDRIMSRLPDRRQTLLTNQGPGPEFPEITSLCMAHNLAKYKRILDFKLSLTEAITNGFSDDQKIWSDGYGDVYRAMHNGEEIVVKKLHSLQGHDDK